MHEADLISDWATTLRAARLQRVYSKRPSRLGVTLSVDQAYAIQFHQLALAIDSGHTLRAIKLGLTDQVQRDTANWQAPSFGSLTDDMMLSPGEPLRVSLGLQPRVEPEIVVVLGETFSAPPRSRDEMLDKISGIHAGIEIVDPRYNDREFILTDALADNASAFAAVYAAQSVDPRSVDLATESAVLSVNGEPVLRGSGAALMGDPLISVEQVIAERIRLGQPVDKGLAIFTGNLAGKAHPVNPGDVVEVSFSTLGRIELVVSD